MSFESTPTYAIGHFRVSVGPHLFNGIKYIIALSKDKMEYVLHADEKIDSHLAIATRAGVDANSVIGGGNIAMKQNAEKKEDGASQFEAVLRGSSLRYKSEPEEIRLIFNNLVKDSLGPKIEDFVANKKVVKEGS